MKRFVLVAGRGYIAAGLNLEVIVLSLCGRNRERGRVRRRPEQTVPSVSPYVLWLSHALSST